MSEKHEEPAGASGKPRQFATWLARIALALFFLAAAITKLIGIERQIGLFDRIGWGQWFRYFTGIAELISAVLLLVPATGLLGALGTFVVSIGALVTLIALGKPVYPALITLVWSGCLMAALGHQYAGLYANIRRHRRQ